MVRKAEVTDRIFSEPSELPLGPRPLQVATEEHCNFAQAGWQDQQSLQRGLLCLVWHLSRPSFRLAYTKRLSVHDAPLLRSG
jgi:hypothetical protein